jgi:hypothetical protein
LTLPSGAAELPVPTFWESQFFSSKTENGKESESLTLSIHEAISGLDLLLTVPFLDNLGPYSLNSAQNNSGAINTQIHGCVEGWQVDNSENVFLKAVFLSGLQTGLSNFSFFLTNVTFDKVRGIIGVTLANSTRAIDMITISYIVFFSPHPRFNFDSFNYPGTIPVADYGMIGSSGFNAGGLSGARYYGINIESILLNCFGSLCPSTCISKANCTQASGLQSANDCILCPSNTRYNETRRVCVPILLACGANE